jgi:hypothetical protein
MEKQNAFISNRYVAEKPLIEMTSGHAELVWHWFVSDTYGERGSGEPREYATPQSELRVSHGYGYWVVSNGRGQWLKGRKRNGVYKASARRFKTPLAAAKAAELLDGTENF